MAAVKVKWAKWLDDEKKALIDLIEKQKLSSPIAEIDYNEIQKQMAELQKKNNWPMIRTKCGIRRYVRKINGNTDEDEDYEEEEVQTQIQVNDQTQTQVSNQELVTIGDLRLFSINELEETNNILNTKLENMEKIDRKHSEYMLQLIDEKQKLTQRCNSYKTIMKEITRLTEVKKMEQEKVKRLKIIIDKS